MNTHEAMITVTSRAMAAGAPLDQSELRNQADSLYNLDKTCSVCGIAILNTFKVLTCQSCRHEQRLSRPKSDSRNQSNETREERKTRLAAESVQKYNNKIRQSLGLV